LRVLYAQPEAISSTFTGDSAADELAGLPRGTRKDVEATQELRKLHTRGHRAGCEEAQALTREQAAAARRATAAKLDGPKLGVLVKEAMN
jgi:hypothetical protein